MRGLGKSLLAGIIAGAIAGLVTYGITAMIWKGVDPERHALSITLIVTFLFGTVTCGIAAARLNPPRAFATAAVAVICFEIVLIVGLRYRNVAIRNFMLSAVAVFLGRPGALIGLPRRS